MRWCGPRRRGRDRELFDRPASARFGRLRSVLAAVAVVATLASACAGASTTAPAGAPGTSPPSPSASPPAIPATVDELRAVITEIASADAATAEQRVDTLWTALTDAGRVPLVLGDDVVFLYRGEASAVHWHGSFNGWSEPGVAGTRVGATDLWLALVTLPARSRIEYQVLRDGEGLADPANPSTSYSGLAGVTSALAMPGFEVTDVSRDRGDAPAGRLEAGRAIASVHLGYPVEYWVYTPAGYEGLDGLPVLYLLDGNDFVDERMGDLPAILDAMISSGRVRPLVAVFVDEREPGNPTRNRREDGFLARPVEHARFIAEELVPAVDAAYRTDPDPDARAIAGVSYGGVAATFITVSHPEVFHGLAALSPSLWVIDTPQYLADERNQAGARLMQEPLASVTGCGEDGPPCVPVRIFLSAGLPDWDVGDLSALAGALDAKGYDLEFLEPREGHTWDQWRGLADEMLTFLVPAAGS